MRFTALAGFFVELLAPGLHLRVRSQLLARRYRDVPGFFAVQFDYATIGWRLLSSASVTRRRHWFELSRSFLFGFSSFSIVSCFEVDEDPNHVDNGFP